MRYCKLGKSDLSVSVIGLGCWAIVGDATWGRQDTGEAVRAIEAALDTGITLFDTAEAYGDGYSEELLGQTLKGHRREVIIADKVSPNHLAPADLTRACESSLRRLHTDYLDLYQIHWPSRTVPLRDTLHAMQVLQRQGKIRAIGVSNFGVQDLSDLAACGRAESNQLCYSLLFRGIEFEIQEACARQELSILCYSPLAQGLLTGKFARAEDVPEGRARTRHFAGTRPGARHGGPGCEAETFAALAALQGICARLHEPLGRVALAWLLSRQAVASVLAGGRSAQQVRENAAAAELALDPAALNALDEATARVKELLGASADAWQAESRLR